ncbi:MAG: FAD-binding oxidoreductase, partial [Anaerolineae bacterium]|nr:FAD-binding oxidoreductase [Anaerolineae bacterium]
MAKSYDIVIVGGGIMGCATAFELADRGVKVALLEKKTVGEGPTGRSSAIVRQHYSNELTARMAYYGLQVFRDFANQVGADAECGFVEAGFLVLVEEKDRAGLEANVALRQRVGIDTAMVSPEALRELLPRMDTHDLVAAAYEPHSGYADPYLTVTSYARAARGRGADLYQDTRVTGIRLDRGRVLGVETDGGRFDAPQVINCTGAWAAGLAATAGIGLPIHSCRVQVVFFRRPAGHKAAHPVVADFGNGVYFRPETGNLTLIGLVDPAEANAIVHPDHYDERVDAEFIMDVGERLVRRYPAMEESQSTGGYASLYAITPDWHP